MKQGVSRSREQYRFRSHHPERNPFGARLKSCQQNWSFPFESKCIPSILLSVLLDHSTCQPYAINIHSFCESWLRPHLLWASTNIFYNWSRGPSSSTLAFRMVTCFVASLRHARSVLSRQCSCPYLSVRCWCERFAFGETGSCAHSPEYQNLEHQSFF